VAALYPVPPEHRKYCKVAVVRSETPLAVAPDYIPTEAEHYCARCRMSRRMVGVQFFEARPGRYQARGTCEECGARLCKNVRRPPMPLNVWIF
jgi:Domain of unknown function (DUF5679)